MQPLMFSHRTDDSMLPRQDAFKTYVIYAGAAAKYSKALAVCFISKACGFSGMDSQRL